MPSPRWKLGVRKDSCWWEVVHVVICCCGGLLHSSIFVKHLLLMWRYLNFVGIILFIGICIRFIVHLIKLVKLIHIDVSIIYALLTERNLNFFIFVVLRNFDIFSLICRLRLKLRSSSSCRFFFDKLRITLHGILVLWNFKFDLLHRSIRRRLCFF